MNPNDRELSEEVLAVYQHACREGDMAVAEHLLRALETMAQRDGDEGNLLYAYWHFAHSLSTRR